MTGDTNKPSDKSNSDIKNSTPTEEASKTSLESSNKEQTNKVEQGTAPVKKKNTKKEKASKKNNDTKVDDNNEEKTLLVEKKTEPSVKPTKSNDKKVEPKAAPKGTQSPSKLIGLILAILLLLLVGLSVGAFYGLQFWKNYSAAQEKRFSELESVNSEQLTKIDAISREQKTKDSDQANLLNTIKQEQDTLQKQLNQRLDSHTERLRSLAGTSRSDWLLAEARYLLRLASQRLLVESSTVGAQALLQSADNILLSIDDPELLPIRSAIAQEIISLKLAKNVDRPGIYIQLSALKEQVQALPLIPFRLDAKPTNITAAPANTEPKKWYSPALNSFGKVLEELKGFVQIRQHNKAPELLISEQQQLQIINNLMLMLEQAQYSLLHEEELIYQESLKKAQRWWRDYYSHYSEYEVINHEINKLLNKEITQTIPSINRSTKLLTDYIDRFHKLNSDTSSANNPSPLDTEEKSL